MKRYKFSNIVIAALLLLAFAFSSCEKWIDPDVNVSENSPTDVPLNLLLPSTQAALFYVLGGDHSRAASIWMQHQAGVDRQAGSFDTYVYVESDPNNLYNTLSATVMKNLEVMTRKSTETNSPHYAGVTNILTAFTLGEMTDIWGDVPYYEAFKAELTGNRTPKYDTQEKLYGTIDSLLTTAITHLQAATSVFSPTSTADLVYRGDRTKWRRLAWTLKLRYKLQAAKRGGYAAATSVLTDNTAIFIDANANDFQFKFGTPGVERGPRYNFESSRGDCRAGKFLVDLMNSTSDPRRSAYFTQVSGAYVGSGPGEFKTASSRMAPFYGAMDAIVPVVTFVEFKFIEAELKFRANDLIGAASAYNAAVVASLAKHSVTADQTWLNANASETAASITLAKIMTGKYVGLYLQSVVFSDWRRTGIPVLPLAKNAVETQIPRRYPYPLNERLYNPNTPAGLKITDRVWWDAQ